MKSTTLNNLTNKAWEMITKYSKDYEPNELPTPIDLTELQDILSNPVSPVASINGLPVYSFKLTREETRDNTEREILYAIQNSKFFII